MPKIKTREMHKDIKTIDNVTSAGERMKRAYLQTKRTTENLASDSHDSAEEYANDKVQVGAEHVAHEVGHKAYHQGKKLVHKGEKTISDRRDHPEQAEETFEQPRQSPPTEGSARQRSHQKEIKQKPSNNSSIPHDEPTYVAPDSTESVSNHFTSHETSRPPQNRVFTNEIDLQSTTVSKQAQVKEATFISEPPLHQQPLHQPPLSTPQEAIPAYRSPPLTESPFRHSQYGYGSSSQSITQQIRDPANVSSEPIGSTKGAAIKQSPRSSGKSTIKALHNSVKSEQRESKAVGLRRRKAPMKTFATSVSQTRVVGHTASSKMQRTTHAAKSAAKNAVAEIQTAAKAVADAAKAIVSGVSGSSVAIILGGCVVLIAVIVLCLLGAIVKSPFGIFFSGDNRTRGAISASAAVAQLNYEFASRLEEIQDGDYDAIDITGEMADWPEVLAVFAVKVAGRNYVDAMDVATLDPKRVAKLRAVFWDMNNITYEVETIVYPDSNPDDDIDDSWSERILHIKITPKTADEIREEYRFTEKQNEALEELLENRDMLLDLIGDLHFISADAQEVVQHLPPDLSEERWEIIKTAATLVGKINYFWGGKSLVIGWDSRWGTIQRVWAAGSSTTGTYRPYGLDCSGFVDWVFYNASNGTYYPSRGAGTYGQHANCTDISWDEAMPGDLVFTAEDSHVGIVGGRDENGNLLIIHCADAGVVITGAGGFISVSRPDCFTS